MRSIEMGQDAPRRYKVTMIYRGKDPKIYMALNDEEAIAWTSIALKHLIEDTETDLVGFYMGLEEEAIIARLMSVRRRTP